MPAGGKRAANAGRGVDRNRGVAGGLCRYANLTIQAGRRLPVFDHTQEPVAQLVEHRTFNAVVAGSSPARLTI
jgi:hypothetical protein